MQHHPTQIKLRNTTRVLEVSFSDGQLYSLPFEYLRVFSPSAEVRGHARGQEILQLGKEQVGIDKIEPIGSYAVRLVFDDGHNSGIFSWDVLYDLGSNQDSHWQDYLDRLKQAGHKRTQPSH